MELSWLDLPTVVALHDEVALGAAGPDEEPQGFRPDGKGYLEGALERPLFRRRYIGDERLATYAAIYLAAVAKAHPFQQGNKRTALLAMRQFLVLNGQDVAITFPSGGEVEAYVRRVAAHGVRELGDEESPLSLDDVATWIEQFYE